jgi:hypothetical protein
MVIDFLSGNAKFWPIAFALSAVCNASHVASTATTTAKPGAGGALDDNWGSGTDVGAGCVPTEIMGAATIVNEEEIVLGDPDSALADH